jgi:hypothetical protein
MNTKANMHGWCPDCRRTLSVAGWTHADRRILICGDCDRDMELIQPSAGSGAPEGDEAESSGTTQEILIIMEGALIQEIDGIPPGIVVRVRDYDVHGVDEDRLQRDGDGRRYIESVWANEESCDPPGE